MESKITIIRDNNGKVLGTKRQNPTTKPVIKKPLTVDGKQVFNITELMRKRQSGEILSDKENKVLDRYLETSQQTRNYFLRKENSNNKIFTESAKTEAEYAARRKQNYRMVAPMKDSIPKGHTYAQPKPFSEPPKTSVTALSEHSPKKINYSLDTKKGGIERAMDKMRQLGETKAELTEKSTKMAKKFAKILEFCKKYGKSIKV